MRYRSVAPLRPLFLALSALTTVPARVPGEVLRSDLQAATAFYPGVGLLVGLLPAAALLLPLPPFARALLALALWTVVTGARPLDGWARSCDAASAPACADAAETRERRLGILRDPHSGVFGVVGVVLLLLGKWTALAYAPPIAPLVAAPTARWAMVHTLRAHPAAHPDGRTAALAGGARLWTATAVLMAVVLPLVARSEVPFRVAGAIIAGALAALLVGELLARRFGGVTGAVCGAAGEAAELAALCLFLPWGAA